MSTDNNNPFNPFANFDFNQLMESYRLPGLDIQAVAEAQRRNIEALTAANQTAFQGLQNVARRQSEIATETLSEATRSAQQLAGTTNPQELTTKQQELVREAFEKATVNMRELAEMMNEANTEAMNIIKQRIEQNMAELKQILAKQ